MEVVTLQRLLFACDIVLIGISRFAQKVHSNLLNTKEKNKYGK